MTTEQTGNKELKAAATLACTYLTMVWLDLGDKANRVRSQRNLDKLLAERVKVQTIRKRLLNAISHTDEA